MTRITKTLGVLFVISALHGHTLVQEITRDPQSQEPSPFRTQLEPVIVTARRYEEDLQKTPISIMAFDRRDIEASGILKLSDVGELVPNMGLDSTAPLSGSSNAVSAFIRGVGQTDFIPTTDPGVGIYIDGVYMARTLGADLDILDIERIEVLRGPQGTLFGKNTIGGAVQIITRKPSHRFAASLRAGYGSFDRMNLKAGVDLPLIDDTLLTRFSIAQQKADGYGERLLDGEDMGDAHTGTFRSAVLWMPSQNVDITWTMDLSRSRERSPVSSLAAESSDAFEQGVNTSALSPLYNALVAPTLNVPGFGANVLYDRRWLTGNPYKTYATGPNESDLDMNGTALTVHWNADSFDLVSISATRALHTEFGRDPDQSPLTIAHSYNEIEQDQWSQEVRVRGHAFSERLDWLVGMYYFEERARDELNIQIVPDLYDAIGMDGHIVGSTKSDNSSSAAFAHLAYHLTKQLELFGGARYTHERKRFDSEIYLSRTGVYLIDPGWHTETFDNISPRVGLSYQWTDDLYSYASASQGFKSGGFVARYVARRDAGPVSFDPETVTTYEIGTKSEWFGKRLRANGAVFFSEYRDIQIIVFEGAAPITKNAARGEITGAELDLSAVPSAGWRIGTGLGYLGARYTDVGANSGISRGDHFVNTPEWSVSSWSEYRLQLMNAGELILFGNYIWKDEVSNDAADTPELRQEEIGLADVRITFAPAGTRARITFFVKNLTDERVIVCGAADKPTFGIVEAIYGPPRVWGISGEIDF